MPYRNLSIYRGDPGFFGSLGKALGKIVKPALKIGQFVPGLGTAIKLGTAGATLLSGAKAAKDLMGAPSSMPGVGFGGPMGPFRGVTSGSGSTLGTARRKYRRMNMANPRALRRSMRRVQGFAKLAHQTISFTKRVRMKKRGK